MIPFSEAVDTKYKNSQHSSRTDEQDLNKNSTKIIKKFYFFKTKKIKAY